MSARGQRRVSLGPGSHDLPAFPEPSPASTVASPAAYSMPSSRRDQQQPEKPSRLGPGAYHPKAELVRTCEPRASFGRAPRLMSEPPRSLASATPGPQLPQGDSARFKASPRYGFGTTVKNFGAPRTIWDAGPGRGTKSPGPGEHCPDDRGTSQYAGVAGPAYSMAAPRREPEPAPRKKPAPGPGSYASEECEAHSSTRPAAPRAKFGTAARAPAWPANGGRRELPGPGRYGHGATRTGHAGFGDSTPRWTMPSGRRDLDVGGSRV